MAKRKRPSGDDVADGDTVVVAPIEVHPDAVIVPPVLKTGEVYVDLLDDNHRVVERIAILAGDAAFQITHQGVVLRHVTTSPDGVWGYAK